MILLVYDTLSSQDAITYQIWDPTSNNIGDMLPTQ